MRYNAEQHEAYELDFKKSLPPEMTESPTYEMLQKFRKYMTDLDMPYIICVLDPKNDNSPMISHNLCDMANKEHESEQHEQLERLISVISHRLLNFCNGFLSFFGINT